MKRCLPRLFLVVATLGTLAFTAGCASFAEGLAQVANEMERQRLEQAAYDEAYYYYPPANASAPGIK
jgi:hypothetical protein